MLYLLCLFFILMKVILRFLGVGMGEVIMWNMTMAEPDSMSIRFLEHLQK